MATSNLSFSAAVDDWTRQTEQRMEAVWKEATQRTVSVMQSYVPVDTGFLRASVRASTESMPQITEASGAPGQSYQYDPSTVVLTIAGAKLGGTIFVGYTANYAEMVNYGTSKMAPRAFVDMAAMRWQITVNEVVAEAKNRA